MSQSERFQPLSQSKPLPVVGRGQGGPHPKDAVPDAASVHPLVDRKLIRAELLKFGVSLITPAEIALHLTGPEITGINDLLEKVIAGVRGAE